MALLVCDQDGVRYAVGLPACPQCGSTKRHEEGAEPAADGAGVVPDGTAGDVITWVGDDPARAALALATEENSARPRTTLIDQLAKLATPEAK